MPVAHRPDAVAIEWLELRRLLSAGDPDLTFGDGGQVEHDPLPHYRLEIVDTFALADGKFLQGGYARPEFRAHQREDLYFLRRVNADGSPDESFGTNGTVYGAFTQTNGWIYVDNVAVAPDGKIYMTGFSSGDFMARFNADGSVDTTFGGGDGVLTAPAIPSIDVIEMIIRPDGRPLLVDDRSRVHHFLADGTRAFFDAEGVLSSTFVMRVQPDGKLLLGGRDGSSFTSRRPALARLNPDGTLDTTFGDGGRVLDAIPGAGPERNQISDIVLLPGGQFLACGTTSDLSISADGVGTFVLARYNTDGTIDTSYGDGGVATIPLGVLTRVVLDADGNAIAIGNADRDAVVARITPQGRLEETFGRVVFGGFADPSEDTFTRLQAAFVQPDGKLVLAGSRGTLIPKTFLTRLHMTDDGVASPVSFDDASDVLTMNGTPAGEVLEVVEAEGSVYAQRSGFGRVFDAGDVSRIDIFANEGNDLIYGHGVESVPIRAFGGLGADRMSGGDANDTLEGSGGDDAIDGHGGDDFILGGNGNDALRGLAGTDTLVGGRGDDFEADLDVPGFTHDDRSALTFFDTDGDDDVVLIREDGLGGLVVSAAGVTDTIPRTAVKRLVMFGEAGNDRLELGPGVTLPVTTSGGAGNDTLIGGSSRDQLSAQDGDDVLIGNGSGDVFEGGSGNDSIDGGGGPDTCEGGDGEDTILGGAGNDALSGAAGNDHVEGGEGDDVVEGSAGDDFVHGGRGADALFGWAGNDTLFADDMFPDTLAGGTGDADTAVIDRFDVVGECEVVR